MNNIISCVQLTGKATYDIFKVTGESFQDLRSLSLNFAGSLFDILHSQRSHMPFKFNKLENLSLDLKW